MAAFLSVSLPLVPSVDMGTILELSMENEADLEYSGPLNNTWVKGTDPPLTFDSPQSLLIAYCNWKPY